MTSIDIQKMGLKRQLTSINVKCKKYCQISVKLALKCVKILKNENRAEKRPFLTIIDAKRSKKKFASKNIKTRYFA